MLSTPAAQKENRRIHRISLSLPIRVEVQVDRSVAWSEITRLSDISPFGAGFVLKRPVKRGRLLQMTMPLPRQLRNYDFLEPQYRIWGLVRRCVPISERAGDESYALGVAFVGKRPPESYLENPAKLYDIMQREEEGLWNIIEAPAQPDESDLPKHQQRQTRFPIPLSVLVEVIDTNGNIIASENTVTENLSLSGAAIFSMLDLEVGSFLRITSEQYNTTIISVVRGKRTGTDCIPRLHVEFIDRFFPLEGIS
ncbi:MAG TPA: PilZ domain-containing protein [Pyrinomonadaceae bacterium]